MYKNLKQSAIDFVRIKEIENFVANDMTEKRVTHAAAAVPFLE